MGVPRRTSEQMETTHLIAFEKHRQRKSYRDIAAEMEGPPHFCGGHTTARRWVEAGRLLVHLDEDGTADPNRKRGARRETAGDTLDALFVKIEEEMTKGLLPRDRGRALQIRALEIYIQVHGLRAAPQPARVKVTGSGGGQVPRELLEQLLALPPDELLPDREENQ